MTDKDESERPTAEERRQEHPSGNPTRRTTDGRHSEPPGGKADDGSPFVPKGSRHGTYPRRYADTVVGGQAGSEGKGAIVAHLLRTGDYGAAVRPGSSNAGHTVYDQEGDSYVHQVIPSAATIDEDVACYMAPESSFGLDEFFEEFQDMADRWGRENALDRVVVDPKAAVITDAHRHTEADKKLGEDIGSTVHGCGAVRVEKIWRSAGDVRLAGDYEPLRQFMPSQSPHPFATEDGLPLGDRVPEKLAGHGRRGEAVMVEGTQGTLLSMNQSPHWPYSTSRDCTASAFLSSTGLPATAARHVWAVFRTYPIRVGGHSGPMDGDEIDFEDIAERAGHTEPPVEFTSVTKKKRRIFEWSWEQFEVALRLNDPDLLALTFLDYLDADNYGARSWWDLTEETREWVLGVHAHAQTLNGAHVAALKTGPKAEHTIDLRTRAPSTSAERWTMGRLPPVDPGDLPEGGHEFAGPDDNWFGSHPTPEANRTGGRRRTVVKSSDVNIEVSGGAGGGGSHPTFSGATGADTEGYDSGSLESTLEDVEVDADEIVDELEAGRESPHEHAAEAAESRGINEAMLGVPGIGINKAMALKSAGFVTIEDLEDASRGELTDVSNVGDALAARIKAHVDADD